LKKIKQKLCSMPYKRSKFLCCVNMHDKNLWLFSYVISNLATQVFKSASRLLSSMIAACRLYLGQTFMYNTQGQKPMRFTD